MGCCSAAALEGGGEDKLVQHLFKVLAHKFKAHANKERKRCVALLSHTRITPASTGVGPQQSTSTRAGRPNSRPQVAMVDLTVDSGS
eukprot:1187903-Prorocentrum_minimum.AAC.2